MGAGKGEVARILVQSARCRVFLMSDELRALMCKRGLKITRVSLQDFATESRRTKGDGFIAESLAKKIGAANARCAVVDGIRNPAEVRVFRRAFGNNFKLVGVVAPLKVRFARARKRGREAEAKTLAAFRESDRREAKSEGFGIAACVKLADATVRNGASLRLLRARVRSILEQDRVLGD